MKNVSNGKFGVKLEKVNVNNFSRVFAYLIDWYIATMISSIPIVFITSAVNHTTNITMDLSKLPKEWGIVAAILAIIFYLGYYFVLELKVYKGQTFGKRIMKLKVVQDDGSDVDFKSIFMREAVGVMLIEGYIGNSSSYVRQLAQMFVNFNIMDMAVYIFGIISVISVLLGAASASRKMIHDRVAHTHLISTKEEDIKDCKTF